MLEPPFLGLHCLQVKQLFWNSYPRPNPTVFHQSQARLGGGPTPTGTQLSEANGKA